MSEVFLILGVGLPVGFGLLVANAVQVRLRVARRQRIRVAAALYEHDDFDLVPIGRTRR